MDYKLLEVRIWVLELYLPGTQYVFNYYLLNKWMWSKFWTQGEEYSGRHGRGGWKELQTKETKKRDNLWNNVL